MKIFVILIMLVALYLLYKIAFAKPPEEPRKDISSTQQADEYDVVGKSRFILPDRSILAQTTATILETVSREEKPPIFAAGNEKKDAVIPSGELDEVFGNEPDPEDLDIPPDDEDETDEPDIDAEEEAEELRQVLGRDAEPAGGFSIEEMESAFEAVNNPTNEKAVILFKVKKTDLFEKLVSGDQGKAERIKAIIDRHIQMQIPEAPKEESSSDLENFNIMEFLG